MLHEGKLFAKRITLSGRLVRIIHELDVHGRKPMREKEVRLSCPKRRAKVTRSVSEGNTRTSPHTLFEVALYATVTKWLEKRNFKTYASGYE